MARTAEPSVVPRADLPLGPAARARRILRIQPTTMPPTPGRRLRFVNGRRTEGRECEARLSTLAYLPAKPPGYQERSIAQRVAVTSPASKHADRGHDSTRTEGAETVTLWRLTPFSRAPTLVPNEKCSRFLFAGSGGGDSKIEGENARPAPQAGQTNECFLNKSTFRTKAGHDHPQDSVSAQRAPRDVGGSTHDVRGTLWR